MKLTAKLLRTLSVGESVVITETRNGSVDGQGDVTCYFARVKPMKFVIKKLILIDPLEITAIKVVKITRVADRSDE